MNRAITNPAAPKVVLGDFSTTPSVLLLSLVALALGLISALIAVALIRLIALFTNAFFLQRLSLVSIDPSVATSRWVLLLMPVVGGLIVGLMARFGSERIRGHGIPEALEAILQQESRVAPRLALLKPISAAISIGSGGPFGSEGPIIMTGGAVGSVIAQHLHLTASERKTLLVAGAAAGMAATFAAPLASTLLAVELLLFEWRPRSLIPVAVAACTAAVARQFLLGDGPIFPSAVVVSSVSISMVGSSLVVGVSAGVLAIVLTSLVYGAEDLFARLPIHWCWWPAIGGLAIGIGGLIFPPALGVGYSNIEALLAGDRAIHLLAGVLIVKAAIWAFSLGSGTSGGVLAPLLMMGAGIGALESLVLPGDPRLWALVGMAAAMGGTMRTPLTGVMFALELTGAYSALLPIVIAVFAAYTCTVLVLRRSILTEKLSRRGRHVSREYALDPLEAVMVHELPRRAFVALRESLSSGAIHSLLADDPQALQRLFPVVDETDRLVAVITRSNLDARLASSDAAEPLRLLVANDSVTASPDETLRSVAHRMAVTKTTTLPIVEDETRVVVGMITLEDLLHGRAREVRHDGARTSTPLWRRRTGVDAGLHGV